MSCQQVYTRCSTADMQAHIIQNCIVQHHQQYSRCIPVLYLNQCYYTGIGSWSNDSLEQPRQKKHLPKPSTRHSDSLSRLKSLRSNMSLQHNLIGTEEKCSYQPGRLPVSSLQYDQVCYICSHMACNISQSIVVSIAKLTGPSCC